MADEQVFLNEGDVFVSNSRIVIAGTTYSTSNVTSVSRGQTAAKMGCAVVVLVVGLLIALSALMEIGRDTSGGILGLIFAAAIIGGAVYWLSRLRPTYHVVIASSSGETQALSSKDQQMIDKVVGSISEAIVHRG